MNSSQPLQVLLTLTAFVSCASTLLAQEIYEWDPSPATEPADWNIPDPNANWTSNIGRFIPFAQFGDVARISNGGTAQVTDTPADVGGIDVANGTLEITPTGTLTSRLGDANQAVATGDVIVGGNGTLRIAGGGELIVQGANLTIAGGYAVDLTSVAQKPIDVTGSAAINGDLTVNFNGAAISTGSTWDLVDATSLTVDLDSISSTGAPVPLGKALSVSQAPGGNGSILRLRVEQRLVLTVDVGQKTATIRNTADSSGGLDIDSYLIESASGSVNPAEWTSIADSNSSWAEAGSGGMSTNALAEFNPTSSTTFAINQQFALGEVFARNYTSIPFGSDPAQLQDYSFTYTNQGETFQGAVEFVGSDDTANNIVLTVNPTTGQATMQNESGASVRIDSYTIASDDGSLLTSWDSLEDQGGPGGTWLEANTSINRLSELTEAGSTLLNQNEGFDLGLLFNTGSAQDLSFQFIIAGTNTVVDGVVSYGDLPTNLIAPSASNPADYNNDGVVDAIDYAVWREGGSPDSSQAGFLLWRANYGASSPATAGAASAATPEPASIVLVGLVFIAAPLVRRRG